MPIQDPFGYGGGAPAPAPGASPGGGGYGVGSFLQDLLLPGFRKMREGQHDEGLLRALLEQVDTAQGGFDKFLAGPAIAATPPDKIAPLVLRHGEAFNSSVKPDLSRFKTGRGADAARKLAGTVPERARGIAGTALGGVLRSKESDVRGEQGTKEFTKRLLIRKSLEGGGTAPEETLDDPILGKVDVPPDLPVLKRRKLPKGFDEEVLRWVDLADDKLDFLKTPDARGNLVFDPEMERRVIAGAATKYRRKDIDAPTSAALAIRDIHQELGGDTASVDDETIAGIANIAARIQSGELPITLEEAAKKIADNNPKLSEEEALAILTEQMGA